MPIITYAPDSNGAKDYLALTKEVIAQEKMMISETITKQTAEIKEHAMQ